MSPGDICLIAVASERKMSLTDVMHQENESYTAPYLRKTTRSHCVATSKQWLLWKIASTHYCNIIEDDIENQA